MKKPLLLIAVLALLAMPTFSQVKFGLKAGANISNVKIEGSGITLNFDSKVGLILGGFAKVNLSEAFVLQPELLYTQYGAKIDVDGMDASMNINYLTIPIMAKYYFDGFNIQAGPQIGILASAKDKMDGEEEDTKDDYNGMDFGINIGAGYDLEMGLGFDVRYNIGLANIVKDSDDVTAKNTGFQITVGYTF